MRRGKGPTRGVGGVDVGKVHVEPAPAAVGQVRAVGGREQLCEGRELGVSFRVGHRGVPTDAARVRKGAFRKLPPSRDRQRLPPKSRVRVAQCRGGDTRGASGACAEGSSARLGAFAGGSRTFGGVRGLEVGGEVGGGVGVVVGAIPVCLGDGSCDRLVHSAERKEGQPLQSVPLGRYQGTPDGGDSPLVQDARPFHQADADDDGDGNRCVEEKRDDVAILRAQCEERSAELPVQPLGVWGSRAGKVGREAREARRQGTVGDHRPIRWGRFGDGSGAADGGGDSAVVTCVCDDGSCYVDGRREGVVKVMHGLTRRAHKTKLPVTVEELAAPLHVAPCIRPMDVASLRRRLSAERQERFDYVWRCIFFPSFVPRSSVMASHKSCLKRDHADLLVKNGVATAASGPGPLANVPFVVVEVKPAGMRLRFILWSKEANSLLDEHGYTADVPLHHISFYLDTVRSECASTRDFKTGFYQVEIPRESRRLFRFCSDDGQYFELTRMPMGHSCAPEIMHTLACAAAGDPDFVRSEFAAVGVTTHCWIDNIRYTGNKIHVSEATSRLDAVASTARITWKEADSRDMVETYEFLGVDFDHGTTCVRPSGRLLGKISSVDLGAVTAGDIECLGGRLLHASAIAGVSPGEHWFSIKYIRRVINSLNKGFRQGSDAVVVPPSVVRDLKVWCAKVEASRSMCEQRCTGACTLFVDASLSGWGGVYVEDDTGRVSVDGAAWSAEEKKLHINVLESYALEKSVFKFVKSKAFVKIFVDNTTVKGVVRKGLCVKDHLLNDAVVRTLTRLKELCCSFSVKWVKSECNPADLPSRVRPEDIQSRSNLLLVSQAVRSFLTGDGVGGDGTLHKSVSSSPS